MSTQSCFVRLTGHEPSRNGAAKIVPVSRCACSKTTLRGEKSRYCHIKVLLSRAVSSHGGRSSGRTSGSSSSSSSSFSSSSFLCISSFFSRAFSFFLPMAIGPRRLQGRGIPLLRAAARRGRDLCDALESTEPWIAPERKKTVEGGNYAELLLWSCSGRRSGISVKGRHLGNRHAI